MLNFSFNTKKYIAFILCIAQCVISFTTRPETGEIKLYAQVLTGEDWNVVMYDGIQAYDGVKVKFDLF